MSSILKRNVENGISRKKKRGQNEDIGIDLLTREARQGDDNNITIGDVINTVFKIIRDMIFTWIKLYPYVSRNIGELYGDIIIQVYILSFFSCQSAYDSSW